jgi:hypothetical protein
VVGYDANKGIIPMLCDKLFKGIAEKEIDAQVSVSMLEIYNECVYDLLSGKRPKGGMKIRNHPKKGFIVPGQINTPVGSYKAIEATIDQGTQNRTIGATAMNATSSRAGDYISPHAANIIPRRCQRHPMLHGVKVTPRCTATHSSMLARCCVIPCCHGVASFHAGTVLRRSMLAWCCVVPCCAKTYSFIPAW